MKDMLMLRIAAALVAALLLIRPAVADDSQLRPTKDPAGAAPILQSAAAEASHVFKTVPTSLYSFGAVNTGAAGFLLLIDGTAVPVDGALTSCGTTNATGCLKACYPIGAGSAASPSYVGFQLSPGPPMPFTNGFAVAYSSTGCITKTLGAANVFFESQPY